MSAVEVVAAVLLLATGFAVVHLKNAVHAALALIANFLVLAAVYVSLDARFLGLIQIIVYAGAIVVLFLFVIMLLQAARADVGLDPLARLKPLAAVGALAMGVGLWYAISRFQTPSSTGNLVAGLPEEIGLVMYGPWVYGLLAVGALLLVATVVAVVLVQPDKHPNRSPEEVGPS